jgi:hypothetical protein
MYSAGYIKDAFAFVAFIIAFFFVTKIRDLNKIRPFILVCLGLAIIADGVFTIFPEINGSIGYNTASYLVVAAMAVYLFLCTHLLRFI